MFGFVNCTDAVIFFSSKKRGGTQKRLQRGGGCYLRPKHWGRSHRGCAGRHCVQRHGDS